MKALRRRDHEAEAQHYDDLRRPARPPANSASLVLARQAVMDAFLAAAAGKGPEQPFAEVLNHFEARAFECGLNAARAADRKAPR